MTRTSRRTLLAGTLGSGLLAQVEAAQEVRLPRKIRLALAGFDGHPEEILRVLPRLPDVELAAVAGEGSDPAALANGLKNRYAAKARHYDTLRELLAAEQVDVVALCNNNGRRAAGILACAARKINVIAEKPLALGRADLDAVYAAVKKSGIHLGMLLPMRFDPPYLAMRRIVESGAIGEVLQMEAQKSYQLGARPEWQKHAGTYGSTILWIAIHSIDLMLFVSGRTFTEAVSLQAHVGFPEAGEMQNVTASLFRLDNGGCATLHMDYLRPSKAPGHGDDRLRVSGSRGIVEYQESAGVTLVTEKSGPEVVRDLPGQQSVFLDYLQSVYQGATPALTWAEIVRANEATLAAHAAAEQRRFVAIGRA
jgi:predicted dehydrogenase